MYYNKITNKDQENTWKKNYTEKSLSNYHLELTQKYNSEEAKLVYVEINRWKLGESLAFMASTHSLITIYIIKISLIGFSAFDCTMNYFLMECSYMLLT